jgi:hypothetical protein
MHCLYFVKVDKSEANTAREAMEHAALILVENQFDQLNGFWGGGKCDWFDVGGRWSGELSGLRIKGDFEEEVQKCIEREKRNGNANDDTVWSTSPHAEKIQELWLSLGGENQNPWSRDGYLQEVFDDDARILTPELIEALRAKHADVEYFDFEAGEEKRISALSAGDVGHWLVVIDYHT